MNGLYYNWHRFYDSENGRYISADPIGLDGGMNLYAYTQNDPVKWIDPWGLAQATFEEKRDIVFAVGLVDAWSVRNTPSQAERSSEIARLELRLAPESKWGGETDALRHAIWLCEMTKIIEKDQALKIAAVHEAHHPPPSLPKAPKGYSSISNWQSDDAAMDVHNNS